MTRVLKLGVIPIRPREVVPVPRYCVMVILAGLASVLTVKLGKKKYTLCPTFHTSLPLDVSDYAV
jgi:hypothetical protein